MKLNRYPCFFGGGARGGGGLTTVVGLGDTPSFTLALFMGGGVGSLAMGYSSYVIYGDIQEGYRQMAADTERETEAREWTEGTAEDIRDEAR